MGVDHNDRVGLLQPSPPDLMMDVELGGKFVPEIEVVTVRTLRSQYLPQGVVSSGVILHQIKPPFLHVWGWRLALCAMILIHRGFRWAHGVHSLYDTSTDGEDHALADVIRILIPVVIIGGMVVTVGVLRLLYRFPWLAVVFAVLGVGCLINNPEGGGLTGFTVLNIAAFQFAHVVCVKALEAPRTSWRGWVRVPPLWSTFVDYVITVMVSVWLWEMFTPMLRWERRPANLLLPVATTTAVFGIVGAICLIHFGVGACLRRSSHRQQQPTPTRMIVVGVPL